MKSVQDRPAHTSGRQERRLAGGCALVCAIRATLAMPSTALTLRRGARLMVGRGGLEGLAGDLLPVRAAVGYQPADGEGCVFEVFAASGVALQGPPLPGLGDGVLDADPPGGLLFAGRFPLSDLTGCGVLPRFLGRGGDLAGEVAGQALVSGVDVGGDAGVAARQVLDALGAQRGGVVHAARADRPEP